MLLRSVGSEAGAAIAAVSGHERLQSWLQAEHERRQKRSLGA
jgi:hypothetical protein